MVPGLNLPPVSYPQSPYGVAYPQASGGSPGTQPSLPVNGDEVSIGPLPPEPALSTRPAAGLLYIVDHFDFPGSLSVPGPFALVEHSVRTGKAHGDMVARAARDQGFSGPMLGVECSSAAPDEVPAELRLWLSSDDPKMLSMCLNERLVSSRVRGLSDVDRALQRILDEYPSYSVINISQGSGQTNLVTLCLDMMMPKDPDNAEDMQSARDERRRVALALGLDADKLCSDDKAVRMQVWPQVVQGLLDRSAATDQDPRVLLAKAAYDKTVQTLADFGNSVVVAAGNEQGLPAVLQDDFGEGGKLRISPQFIGNDLASPQTLVVGALHEGRVADYSNRIPSVRIYASGDLEEDVEGTSFAAPRVSAVLAELQSGLTSSNMADQSLRQHYCIKQELDSQPVYFLRP